MSSMDTSVESCQNIETLREKSPECNQDMNMFSMDYSQKSKHRQEKEFVQTEESVGIFQRDVDRHALYSNSAFCKTRANPNSLVVGLLFLIKHFGVQHRLRLSEEAFIRDCAVSIRDQIFKT